MAVQIGGEVGDAGGGDLAGGLPAWLAHGAGAAPGLRPQCFAVLFRYDDEIVVNPHVYGEPASANPAFHLRRLDGGTLAGHYMAAFDRVWDTAIPWSGGEV